MDAPAALKTIATGELAFTDPGSIYLDGKNVLGLVVEIDSALLGGATLVGVVAETLTRGKFNVRHRARRATRGQEPDARRRSSSIRSTATSRSATSTTWRTRSTSRTAISGAYRARLNANLAFWDGLDGKADWPTDENGGHPLTELVLADFLVVDVTKPYAEQGSFLEIELAARRGEAHETCGGRALNDDVMDTIFTQLINAGNGPVIRDGVDHSTRPGLAHVPVPGAAQSGPARAARAPPLSAVTAHREPSASSSTTSRAGRCTSARRPTSAPTCCCASTTAPPGASSSGGCSRRRRLGTALVRSRPRRLDHRRLHLPRPEGARRAAGLARQLRAGVPGRDGRPRGAAGRRRREQPGALGEAARHAPTSTSPWRRSPPTRARLRGRGREGPPRPRRSSPASR